LNSDFEAFRLSEGCEKKGTGGGGGGKKAKRVTYVFRFPSGKLDKTTFGAVVAILTSLRKVS